MRPNYKNVGFCRKRLAKVSEKRAGASKSMHSCVLLLLWFLLAGFLFCCHEFDAEPDYLTIAKAA
jgi:hypothetical protein